jgi:hypothetical protein
MMNSRRLARRPSRVSMVTRSTPSRVSHQNRSLPASRWGSIGDRSPIDRSTWRVAANSSAIWNPELPPPTTSTGPPGKAALRCEARGIGIDPHARSAEASTIVQARLPISAAIVTQFVAHFGATSAPHPSLALEVAQLAGCSAKRFLAAPCHRSLCSAWLSEPGPLPAAPRCR